MLCSSAVLLSIVTLNYDLCHAVHRKQGKGTEADSLYSRAIEIGEKALGPDHPDVATLLNNKGVALSYQVRAVRIFYKFRMQELLARRYVRPVVLVWDLFLKSLWPT